MLATSAGFATSVARGAGPDHHRRDDEARSGDEVVEPAENGARVEIEADLLGELAERGLLRRFAGVDSAARERPLIGMVAKMRGAPRQDQRGFTAPCARRGDAGEPGSLALFGDGDRHGGDAMRAGDGAVQLERAQAALDLDPSASHRTACEPAVSSIPRF